MRRTASEVIRELEMRIARLERQSALNDHFITITKPLDKRDADVLAENLRFNDRGVAYVSDPNLFASELMKYPRLILKEMMEIEERKMGYAGSAGMRDEFGEVMYDEMDEWMAANAAKRFKKLQRSKINIEQVVSPRTGKNGWVLTLR
jgi:hypothetical protein